MRGSDFEGLVSDPYNYDGGISKIEIPHEWAERRNGALTEEQSIYRSELGTLKWVARIGRPGAIYDASAAARTFADGEMVGSKVETEELSKIEENGDPRAK